MYGPRVTHTDTDTDTDYKHSSIATTRICVYVYMCACACVCACVFAGVFACVSGCLDTRPTATATTTTGKKGKERTREVERAVGGRWIRRLSADTRKDTRMRLEGRLLSLARVGIVLVLYVVCM